ncbi:MAG TPA: presqualene diphosphate synthase HpnD [Candidatus Polarisedimenticolia bacterium]|nr:presqualene diphosphate synthase HpnD [Candidatus Polarisedimenticolia bacterium]
MDGLNPPLRGRASLSRGSSFHYSFGLLPRPRRQAIEAVYAFCRTVDDLTDDRAIPPAEAAGELAEYRREIDRCYGGSPHRPVTRGLARWTRQFDIPRQPFLDLLDGVEMDLHTTRYATFDDLRVYCYRVASTVGIICVSIFGCRHPQSREYAVELGLALQLTNILRDLKSDAGRGRIYLPLDDMRRCGYSEAELLAGTRNAAYLDLMRLQAGRARIHFERAAALLPDVDRRRLLAAEVMGAIYGRLLRRMEEDGFPVFERRVKVPRLQQLGIALRAYLTGRAGP